MRRFTEAKAWYCPLTCFFVLFFICLLILQIPYDEIMYTRRLLNVHHDSDDKTFAEVLKGVSMPDRTILLSIVNREQASPGSILDLFVESFKVGTGTKHFLNHLVIVATDIKAFQYCKSVHPHCFRYAPSRNLFRTDELGKNLNDYMSSRMQLNVLKQVLDLGYNFFYTDADVMWLRNPFKYVNPVKEMTFSSEFYTDEDTFSADMGLFYIKAADISLEFFRYWNLARFLYPDTPNKDIFKKLIEHEDFQIVRSVTNIISTVHYAGFCQPSNDISKISTWHANCCNNLEDKVHDLKLVLQEWKRYKYLGSYSTSGSLFRCSS